MKASKRRMRTQVGHRSTKPFIWRLTVALYYKLKQCSLNSNELQRVLEVGVDTFAFHIEASRVRHFIRKYSERYYIVLLKK